MDFLNSFLCVCEHLGVGLFCINSDMVVLYNVVYAVFRLTVVILCLLCLISCWVVLTM